MTKPDGDLGYTFRRLKTGDVAVSHHGCLATTLHGAKAANFLLEMPRISHAEQQRKMATLTGHHATEKSGRAPRTKDHPRDSKPD